MLTRYLPKFDLCRGVSLLTVIWMGLVGACAMAQGSPKSAVATAPNEAQRSVKQLRFDVVSIRPSKGDRPSGLRITENGFNAIGQPLSKAILMAYLPFQFWANQPLKGVPAWVLDKRYDIVAKVAAEDLPEWQKSKQTLFEKSMLETMLQAALAERCKLVLHRVEGETTSIALEAKKGAKMKLKPSEMDQPIPDGGGMALSDGGKALFTGKDDRIEWTFYHASMADLIRFMQMTFPMPIENNTGLDGKYDFVLSKLDTSSTDGLAAPGPEVIWDLDAVGFTLKRAKARTETLVIDHVEEPTEN